MDFFLRLLGRISIGSYEKTPKEPMKYISKEPLHFFAGSFGLSRKIPWPVYATRLCRGLERYMLNYLVYIADMPDVCREYNA
jgi:hypothetical protein